jgi:hypothetical protein
MSDSIPFDIEFGIESPEVNCNDEFGVGGNVPLEILIGLVGVVTFIDEFSSLVIDDDLSLALLA